MNGDAYAAAVGAMHVYYGGLLQDVVKEYGWDTALALHAKRGWSIGASTVQGIKRAAGGKAPDVAAVDACVVKGNAAFGVTFTTEKTENSVVLVISRCPIYDGLQASGFSHDQIGLLCQAVGAKHRDAVASLLPQATWRADFRTSPDACCRERWDIR